MPANDYPTVINGSPVDADLWFNAIGVDLTALKAQIAGGLADFSASFTLTASTTNPTKGSSVYVVKYAQELPKKFWYSMRVTIGSGFVAGSGVYKFLTPFTMDTSIAQVVPARVLDTGTATRWGVASPFDSTHLAITFDSQGSSLGNAGPGTAWATGDVMEIVGSLWTT